MSSFESKRLCSMEWARGASSSRRKRRSKEYAAAALGGFVAELSLEDAAEGAAGELRVFDSCGRLRWSAVWNHGPVASGGLGWTAGALLVCVLAKGDAVVTFSADSGGLAKISRLPSTGRPRICAAHVWVVGFVVVTESLEVVEGCCLSDFERGRIQVRCKLDAAILGGELPSIVTVLRPFVSREEPEAASFLLANPSMAGVIVVESDGTVRSQLALSSAVERSLCLIPHPTYRLIASYGEDGVLSVLPFDFCQVLITHDCRKEFASTNQRMPNAPQSVYWCGLSTFALCLTWFEPAWTGPNKTGTLVVSLENRFSLLSSAHLKGSDALSMDEVDVSNQVPAPTSKISHPGWCFTCGDVDGLRMIGKDTTWIIRQVPEALDKIFGLGSTDPAAMFMETIEMLDSGDAEADEGLRALVDGDFIAEAIETCLEAAEFLTSAEPKQGLLLRVASYGKRFLPATKSGKFSFKLRRRIMRRFVAVCEICRLAKIATEEGGIALTPKQLRIMTPRILIDRLLFDGQFLLAFKLCPIAKVPMTHVIIQWAAKKIHTYKDDGGLNTDEVALEIERKVNKCKEKHGIVTPYAMIAAVAASLGCMELAMKLSEKELKLSRKVLLLLKLEDFEGALKSISTEPGGDPDLHLFVASKCVEAMPFERIVAHASSSTWRFDLFSRLLRRTDQTLYKRLLLALDKKKEKALVMADESTVSSRVEKRMELLQESSREFLACAQKGLSHLTQEQAKLLQKQNKIGDSLISLSVANTVLDCLRRGLDDEAESFAAEFKLGEKAYRRIQLRGLVARKAWSKIQELSYQSSVRNVLDGADFAEACLSGGQKDEAIKYVYELDNTHDRKANILIRLGLFEEAIEAAHDIGNTIALEMIRRLDPKYDSIVREKLDLLATNGAPLKPKLESKDRAAIAAFNAAREKAVQGCAQQ